MSAKSQGARYPQGRTDTLIGAGMRVEGHIAFTGALHVYGEVLGDVSCDGDASGTLVVGKSGNVIGAIRVPHVVVGGHVCGPVHSSASLEVQAGARVAGDARYKAIEIHAGGVVDGALTPADAMDGPRLPRDRGIREPAPPTAREHGMAPAAGAAAGGGFDEGSSGRRKLGATVALLLAVLAGVVVSRDPAPLAPVAPTAASVAPKAELAANGDPAPQSAIAGGRLADAAKLALGAAESPAPDAATPGSAVNAPGADPPGADRDAVVMIQGVNPTKPAGVFLVIGKQPAVLFKKQRQDPAAGSRIDIAEGATESIAIARNEVLRVAQGRDLTIFYQGRKVAPKIIESGAWMSFAPQSPGVAAEKD